MASPAKAPVGAVREVSQRNAVSLDIGSITPIFEKIALRAHKIWRREGEVQGKDQEHWFQAIAELASETVSDEDDDDEDDDAAISSRKEALICW
jgi:hypothetical protein